MADRDYSSSLKDVLNSLSLARRRLLIIYDRYRYFQDDYIDGTFDKGTESFNEWNPIYEEREERIEKPQDLLLPLIYGLESILIPVGYLEGLFRARPEYRVIDELNEFSYKAIRDDETIFKAVGDFEKRAGNLLKGEKFEYEKETAAPYDKYWNYDAMVWAFALGVDLGDYWQSRGDVEKAATYESHADQTIENLLMQQLELPLTRRVERYTLRCGWYFGPDVKEALYTNTQGRDYDETKGRFLDAQETKEVFAVFGRAVLSGFDIAVDALSGREKVRQIIQDAIETLKDNVIPWLTDRIVEVCDWDDSKYRDVGNSDYLVQLLGLYTAAVSRGLGSEILKKKEVEEKFVDRVIMSVSEELENPDSKLNNEEKLFCCWKELPVDEEDDSRVKGIHHFRYISILPILIRSLSQLLINSRERVIAEKGFFSLTPDLEKYEDQLRGLVDLLKKGKIEEGDHPGLWSWKAITGSEGHRNYELAYTVCCVEALTLYTGYLVRRCFDTRKESGIDVPRPDEVYKSFEEFRGQLRGWVTEVARDAARGPGGRQRDGIWQLTLPGADRDDLRAGPWFTENLGELVEVLSVFLSGLVGSGDEEASSDPGIEMLRHYLLLSRKVARIRRVALEEKRQDVLSELHVFHSKSRKTLFKEVNWNQMTCAAVWQKMEQDLQSIQDKLESSG